MEHLRHDPHVSARPLPRGNTRAAPGYGLGQHVVLADTATLTGRTCPCLSRSKYSPFFIASDGFSGVQLWRSDGTAAGTVPVKVWPEAGWFALAAEEVKGIHSSSRPMRDLLVVTHGCLHGSQFSCVIQMVRAMSADDSRCALPRLLGTPPRNRSTARACCQEKSARHLGTLPSPSRGRDACGPPS